MNTKIRALLAAAVSVVAICAFTQSASAGTYTLTPSPCQQFFTLGASNGNAWGAFCVGNTAILNITGQPKGVLTDESTSYRWMKTQEVPAGVYLTGVLIHRYVYSSGGSTASIPPIAFHWCTTNGYNYTLSGTIPCPWSNYPGDNGLVDSGASTTNNTNWLGTGGTGVNSKGASALAFRIWPTSVRQTSNGNQLGSLGIDELTFALNDPVAPTMTRNAASITATKWVSGTKNLSASAADTGGSGVREARAYWDNQPLINPVIQDYNASCNWNSMSPCPSSVSYAKTYDTNTLVDGKHTLRYSAVDVADTSATPNNATTSPVDVYVDNTKPDTPINLAAEADGQNGWSAVNNFGASWTNGAESTETATQSGIEKVIVDVNPTGPDQTDPAAVEVPVGGSASGISATRTSVSGVAVPANGKWTMQIRLKDAAGNTSDVGDAERTVGLDPDAPPKANGNNNGWVSRAQLMGGTAKQTWEIPQANESKSPICGWGLSASQDPNEIGHASIDVHAPTTNWSFPSDLPEGSSWAHIRAISCAGVPASVTEHQEVKVDLTDPTASFEGIEPGRWYKDGQSVTMRGVDALSGMTPAPVNVVEATKGAYITYTVNGNGPALDDSPRGGAATLAFSGEGEKDLVFSPVDLAGNKASPVAVRFGIDATDPTGYLENQDENAPTLIRAPIADPTSGVDHAVVQIRNAAGGNWENLPTSLSSFSGGQVGSYAKAAVAEARFPDTKLPKGTYNVRVAAYDQAGNELVTAKTKSGTDLTIVNPMRKPANISAALFGAKRTCGRLLKKKNGKIRRAKRSKCVKRVRGKVVFIGGSASRTVGWQRGAIVQGYLTGASYAPLAGKHVDFYTRATGKDEVLAGSTVTKSDGSYAFRLGKGVSRKVRVVYEGSELIQNVETTGYLGTRASVGLRMSRTHVRSGGKVKFTGVVKTYDKVYPVKGKIIVLQFKQGKKWRPAIALARTSANGRFSVTYRFGRIPKSVKAKIKFRVYVPTEIDFAHENSASKTKIVKVN